MNSHFNSASRAVHVANNAVIPLIERLEKVNGLQEGALLYASFLALATELVQGCGMDPSELIEEISTVARESYEPTTGLLVVH